jgi:Ca2+-binding EF-hand superfamily protein
MKIKTNILFAALALGAASIAGAGERTFGGGAGELPEFLVVFDVDEDGKLNEEERQAVRDFMSAKREERRAEWDTNGDGQLSEAEIEAAREEIRRRLEERRCERFDELDIDDSGSLSLAEFSAIPALADASEERILALFDRVNGDDDEVSKEEFLALLRHRDRPPGPRPPRPTDRPRG